MLMVGMAALNRIKATETHTEITTGAGYSAEIQPGCGAGFRRYAKRFGAAG